MRDGSLVLPCSSARVLSFATRLRRSSSRDDRHRTRPLDAHARFAGPAGSLQQLPSGAWQAHRKDLVPKSYEVLQACASPCNAEAWRAHQATLYRQDVVKSDNAQSELKTHVPVAKKAKKEQGIMTARPFRLLGQFTRSLEDTLAHSKVPAARATDRRTRLTSCHTAASTPSWTQPAWSR